MKDINETAVFVQNLRNIVEQLKLSKAKLNEKLGWPKNKLSNIIALKQAPLIDDSKQVRVLLNLEPAVLLTKTLTTVEIDNLAKNLHDIKLKHSISANSKAADPILYIIVILYKAYNLDKEFTKKGILKYLPLDFSNYKIEWQKNRLKSYVNKIKEITNSENKKEHVFKLTKEFPLKMVKSALAEVEEDWLKEFEEKLKEE